MQFDIYFYELSDPSAVPVTSRMLEIGEIFSKNLGQIAPESVILKDLLAELDKLGRNRLPVLGSDSNPLFIIHRSMIEQFMLSHVLGPASGKNVDTLTFADLLADPKMEEIFKNTFVVVNRDANLAEVKEAMRKTPNCLDVFVTDTGSREEPVLGWLSNIIVNR